MAAPALAWRTSDPAHSRAEAHASHRKIPAPATAGTDPVGHGGPGRGRGAEPDPRRPRHHRQPGSERLGPDQGDRARHAAADGPGAADRLVHRRPGGAQPAAYRAGDRGLFRQRHEPVASDLSGHSPGRCRNAARPGHEPVGRALGRPGHARGVVPHQNRPGGQPDPCGPVHPAGPGPDRLRPGQ